MLPDELAKMQSEILNLYAFLEKKCDTLIDDSSIAVMLITPNNPWVRHVEYNAYTLSFMPELNNPNPFFRIAICNSRLNKDGHYIDRNSEQVVLDFDKVTIEATDYNFVDTTKYGKGWTEAPQHTKFTPSPQMVEDWIEKFLDAAL